MVTEKLELPPLEHALSHCVFFFDCAVCGNHLNMYSIILITCGFCCSCIYWLADVLEVLISHNQYYWQKRLTKWSEGGLDQQISWWKQVNLLWDDDEVCFVLNKHAKLDFYRATSLKQQSMDRHVVSLRHIILIPSQPVFALSP